MTDTRIPYGARCTWWDSIDKAGQTLPGINGHRLPCCPVCRGMLFEVESEAVWWAGAERHEANGHPGYVDMLRWSRGRCFRNYAELEAAYAARPAPPRAVTHTDTPRRPTKRQRRRQRGRKA